MGRSRNYKELKAAASGKKAVALAPLIPPVAAPLPLPQIQFIPRHERQRQVIDLWPDSRAMVLTGPAGTGKAQPLDAVVMTPSGPVPMGQVYVGQTICSADGGVCSVTGVFPQGVRPVFRITFSDGSVTECCGDHLWQVGDISRGWTRRVVDTKYILANYRRGDRNCLYIPVAKPVHFDKREFLIDPYLMGIILSDGGISHSIVITTADDEILERIRPLIHADYHFRLRSGSMIDYSLSKIDHKPGSKSVYFEELRRLGLFGHCSHEKHIPPEYLHTSVSQRIDLLQGLMDGDGTVDKRTGMPIYYTTSLRLANDFRYLVASLGGTCSTHLKHPKYFSKVKQASVSGKECYVISVCLPSEVNSFSLERKAKFVKPREKYFPRRYIADVQMVGEKPVQCISVSHESRLYLTDNFIVTHNTASAFAGGFLDIVRGAADKVLVAKPVIGVDEDLGFFPGGLDEKLLPWMGSVEDVWGKMSGGHGLAAIGERLELRSVGLCRGRTVSRATLIVDEAQNCTLRQLVTLLTRPDDTGRIILCGDPAQCDLPADKLENGVVPLTYVVRRLQRRRVKVRHFHVVNFLPEDQQRSAFVREFLSAMGL